MASGRGEQGTSGPSWRNWAGDQACSPSEILRPPGREELAGAISTGTHGTGARLRNISAQVEAIELVLADGSVRELSAAGDPQLLRAARVGIGALGAISAVTLRCVPAFVLHRVDAPCPREEVLAA